MVMGPSGNGKTTMLNCLSGLDDIDAGTVSVDGEDLHAMTDAQRTEHRARRMGFIFQSFNLIPVFTAAENVELPLLCTGVRAPGGARAGARHARARRSRQSRRAPPARAVGRRAAARRHRPGAGQRARHRVGRRADRQPRHAHRRPTCSHLLREFHAAGQTLVVVTHDHQIGTSSERLVQMIDGLVNYDGHPDGAPPDPTFDS